MRKVVRNGVFETNSSSVHTLSISKDGMEESYLPVDSEGYILTDFGSFGKDLQYYTTQEEKLSYLITCCYYLGGWDTHMDNCYVFRKIEKAICEYAGAKGIKILGENEPEIDHQSQPNSGWDLNVVNGYNGDEVVNFVFNKFAFLKTDCD